MNFKKVLSKIGIVFGWILMLPAILIVDVLVFIALPFEALVSLLTDQEL